METFSLSFARTDKATQSQDEKDKEKGARIRSLTSPFPFLLHAKRMTKLLLSQSFLFMEKAKMQLTKRYSLRKRKTKRKRQGDRQNGTGALSLKLRGFIDAFLSLSCLSFSIQETCPFLFLDSLPPLFLIR
jgi:hypothetical protein